MSHSHPEPLGAGHAERRAFPASSATPRSAATERPAIHELGGEVQFILPIGHLTRRLLHIVAAFVAIQVVILVWRLGFHGQGLKRLSAFFTLDAENNLPTFFSSALLMMNALLCTIAGRIDARHEPAQRRYWYLLAGVFTFLAVDEAAQVHEFIGHVIRSMWMHRGLMQWPWVIPYLVFAAVVGFYCVPFLRRLPPAIMQRCFVAGVVYVTGAAGMDMIEGLVSSAIRSGAGQLQTLFLVLPVIEESLEMIGIILFASAILRYLEGRADILRIRITR